MTNVTFVDFSDPKVDAAWLNDVNTHVNTALVAGANITLTPAPGTITIASTGGAGFGGIFSEPARSIGVQYTNTNPGPLFISVSMLGTVNTPIDDSRDLNIVLDGVFRQRDLVFLPGSPNTQNYTLTISFFVAPGSTYEITALFVDPFAVIRWYEFV